MNAEQKDILYSLLETALCHLSDGKRSFRPSPGFTDDLIHPANEIHDLEGLSQAVTVCELCATAQHTSELREGEGSPAPRVLVVTDAPVQDSSTNQLFTPPQKALLEKMLAAISLSLSDNTRLTAMTRCYNGSPHFCRPWFDLELALSAPSVLLVLGEAALSELLHTQQSLDTLRNKALYYQGLPVVVTFHPRDLLLDEQLKRPAWEDLKGLKKILESPGHPDPAV
ncbi:MAG TPA: uracil-DNA glycosylase [Treponemataceae bacterium]|nr:uracil-DNA glycosylase [Treponemataceae bacterium]